MAKKEGKEYMQDEKVKEKGKEEKEGKEGEDGEDGEEGEDEVASVVESKMERATCYEYGVHHSGFPLT